MKRKRPQPRSKEATTLDDLKKTLLALLDREQELDKVTISAQRAPAGGGYRILRRPHLLDLEDLQ